MLVGRMVLDISFSNTLSNKPAFSSDFCRMFAYLKKKWKVSWPQFALIFSTFALGGSLCAKLGSGLLQLILDEQNWVYWILYVPLITLLWPICVLGISIPLGQFRFFQNYLLRMWKRITGKPVVTRLAIFASGTGSNAETIIGHFKGHKAVEIALIVSNKPGAGVLQIAAAHHIPTWIIDRNTFLHGNGYVDELMAEKIDFIVLAGFLWKLPSSLIEAFPRKIVNIHPALLPKYGGKGMYGLNVHQAVLAAGEQDTGITIHYVDEHYDNGDIIFQEKCGITAEDTPESVSKKVQQLEHKYYPAVIEKLLKA